MQKLLNVKNIIALLFIIAGLAIEIGPRLPNITPNPKPDIAILNIDKPTEDILALVQPASNLILDPNDRAKLAIYSQEFAKRVKNYDAKLQQINDVLALSAEKFFQGSIKDKYAGFDDAIISLITVSVGGDENHKLTESEKNKLSETFMGLAWALIQRK